MKVKGKALRVLNIYKVAGETAEIKEVEKKIKTPKTPDPSGSGKFGKMSYSYKTVKVKKLIVPNNEIEIKDENDIVEIDIPDKVIINSRKWENVKKALISTGINEGDIKEHEDNNIDVLYNNLIHRFKKLPDGTVILPYTLHNLIYGE